MEDWQGVSEFIAVAETQSFTRAAQQLNSSVANISRQVRQLEQRLGTELFYRTTRRVSLTEAGDLYYRACRPLLDGLQDAQQAVSELQTTPQGLIRLTAPVTYGEHTLAPLLNRFLQQFPDIRLHCEFTNQTLDIIADHYDLALRLGHAETPNLVARRLGGRRWHTCASPSYLREYGTPAHPGELPNHSCLKGSRDEWWFQIDGSEQRLRIHGRLRSNSGGALLDAALRGLGIVQLPDYYVSHALNSGTLVAILEAQRPADDGIWALYPPGRQLSPKVNSLLNYLSDHIV